MLAAMGTADGVVGVNTADFASTGEKVFVSNSKLYGWNPVWTGTTRLKATFASPVSEVRIDAIGNSENDYGRLEAYDAQGKLLGRYITFALNAGDVETMLVKRPTAEIAYIIAEGHANSGLLLDNHAPAWIFYGSAAFMLLTVVIAVSTTSRCSARRRRRHDR